MRRLAVLPVGLLALALLAGCGGSEHSDSEKGSGARGAPYAATAPSGPPALRESGPASPKQQNSDSADATVERKEIVTGSVDITTDDPIGAAGKVADRVRTLDGRVDSRSEQPGTDTTEPRATLTIRVPADKTDAFVDGLGGIGEVTSVTTERSDVTMQWQDLDARIKALQASVDRLRALVSSAATTADLIAAENALSSRQGELDSLTARKRQLDDEVALSTLTVQLSTDEPPGSKPDNYWNRIVDGWNSLLRALKSTGNALPWLAFLLVLAALAWGVVRLATRRRSPAPHQPPPTRSESERQPATAAAPSPAETTTAERTSAPAQATAAEEVSAPAQAPAAEKASASAEPVVGEGASASVEPVVGEGALASAEPVVGEGVSASAEPVAGEGASSPAEPVVGEGTSSTAQAAAAEKASASAKAVAGEGASAPVKAAVGEGGSAPAETAAGEKVSAPGGDADEKGSGRGKGAAAEEGSPQQAGTAEPGGADAADRRPGGDQAQQ
ncbi:DUF4349 domain-containing protein [Nocardia wallacei]|uniref:DUF4349 domain-containing protein n=1 Tax=Nocardia wallacei TaxID=480035 RepID=UPI002458AE16|nr:DUF4349 domain-containing protein [Nocardia wallacei]